MAYKVLLSREAESVYRWLSKRDPVLFKRIDACLDELKKNPTIGKPLQGAMKGDFSCRIGSYRIIYTIQHQRLIVYILDIGHRKEIYR